MFPLWELLGRVSENSIGKSYSKKSAFSIREPLQFPMNPAGDQHFTELLFQEKKPPQQCQG